MLQEREVKCVKKKFIEMSCALICKYENCDELQLKKIKYGLESVYTLITKVIVMFILAILLHLLKEYLLLILIYSTARRYAYGLHAKKSITCWLVTLPTYMLGCYFIKFVSIPTIIMYVLWVCGFISFFLWAPADTPARPLIHPEIRRKQKIKACFICIGYLICILVFQTQWLNNAFIYSLIVQSICINPITYKITKTPFDNYKLYYETHGLNY